MKVSIFRRAHFNAAHRLHNPDWTDEKNMEVFGVCSNPNYHGHNYELEVKVSGEIDPETGMVLNLAWLADLIKREVEHRFDHKNLKPVVQVLNFHLRRVRGFSLHVRDSKVLKFL